MIQENIPYILPNWLNFIYGMIDIPDINSNFNFNNELDKEILLSIKPVLLDFIFDMFDNIKDENKKSFIQNYNTNLKLGLCIEKEKKEKIIKHIYFNNNLNDSQINVSEYLKNNDDDNINYLISIKEDYTISPYLEHYNKHNMNVLILEEPIDIYLLEYIPYKFINIVNIHIENDLTYQYQSLINKFKQFLSVDIDDVIISNRLISHIGCIYSSNNYLENNNIIDNYQILFDNCTEYKPESIILELNSEHYLIQHINNLLTSDSNDNLTNLINLIFYMIVVNSKYYDLLSENIPNYNKLMESVIKDNYLVSSKKIDKSKTVNDVETGEFEDMDNDLDT